MITMYLVDKTTRILLPDSAWAFSLREKLSQKGRSIQALGPEPEGLVRDEAEMERVNAILDEFGSL